MCVCVFRSFFHYSAHMLRWSSYLQLINSSLVEWTSRQCSEECGCHSPVINADLAVWRERGGITYQDFLSAKESRFRGVHYQIIDHVLYRQPECMFGPRYDLYLGGCGLFMWWVWSICSFCISPWPPDVLEWSISFFSALTIFQTWRW